MTTRDGFGLGLLELGQKNPEVVVVNADLIESNRVESFAKQFPERFFQVGVAEQNLAGIGMGLALGGKIPFITSFSIFSPGINWLPIRQACLSGLKMVVASTHAGLSNGPDGATHQALEDVALMRTLPFMSVVVPADGEQCKLAVQAVADYPSSVYLRMSKTEVPDYKFEEPFEIGKAQTVQQGSDLTIITNGNMFHECLLATKELESQGKSVGLINLHTIKPLDEMAILNAAKSSKFLVTVEEHQVAGGLGSALAEFLATTHPTKIFRIGMNDEYGQTGTIQDLFKHYKLDAMSITQTINSYSSL